MPAYYNENSKTWYAKFNFIDWQGNSKQKLKRGFSRKKDALEFEREFLKKQSSDISMNFSSFVDIYLEDMGTRIRATTLYGKKCMIQSKIIPYFKDKSINEIKTSDIRKWQNIILKQNFSPTYEKTLNNQLVAIFNYAVKYYDLSSNPCSKAGSIGKKNSDRHSFWTVEDFNTFIAAAENDILSKTLFTLLYWTGMRVGEALALTKNDIDFENGTVAINKSYTRLNREDKITPPKTPKSNRKISIHKELVELLQEYINKLPYLEPSDRLFEISKISVRTRLNKYAKKANVNPIRVHDLRHSHASLLIEIGFSPLLIASRLGHENIQTTLQTYSHLYPNKETELIQTIENIIENQ